MVGSTAVVDRMARFDEQRAFFRRGAPGPAPSPAELDGACSDFADGLYPRYQAGEVVLDVEAAPEDSDAAVRQAGAGFAWLTAIDAASGPDYWWYSRGATPSRDAFRAPVHGEPLLCGKPLSGLFTSGGSASWKGMWSSVAGIEMNSKSLRPWRLERPREVREVMVDSAVAWCRLVEEYPRPTAGGLVPDWAAVARDHDVVTVTAVAVAATDCVGHRGAGGAIAPTYWATRTSLWLRWMFDEVS